MDVAREMELDPTESKPHKSTASEIENGHDPTLSPWPLGSHCHSAEDADPTILQGALESSAQTVGWWYVSIGTVVTRRPQ